MGRLAQHRNGHTHTTCRLGGEIQLIASREFGSRTEAISVERMLKRWKNPLKAVDYLQADPKR